MAFKFSPYQLEGLLVVEGSCFPDERGVFMETFRENELKKAGIPPWSRIISLAPIREFFGVCITR